MRQDSIVPTDTAGEILILVLCAGSPGDELEDHFEVVTFDPDTRRPLAGSVEWRRSHTFGAAKSLSEPIDIDGCRRLVTKKCRLHISGIFALERPEK